VFEKKGLRVRCVRRRGGAARIEEIYGINGFIVCIVLLVKFIRKRSMMRPRH
jgi:hypothetical protein